MTLCIITKKSPESDPSVNKNDSTEATKPLNSHEYSTKKAKKKFKAEKVNITNVEINGPAETSVPDRRLTVPKVNSTPNRNAKVGIKPILRGADPDNSLDVTNVPQIKRKKRNKSVSFILEENEGVAIKKTKSNDTILCKNEKSKNKKIKHEKENKNDNNVKIDVGSSEENTQRPIRTGKKVPGNIVKKRKPKSQIVECEVNEAAMDIEKNEFEGDDKKLSEPVAEKGKKKKKNKHIKKQTSSDKVDSTETEPDKDVAAVKKIKKKSKVETGDMEVPEKVAIKKKPPGIAEGIKNLNIGDNPHSLTKLIEGITVTKSKKKNNKKRKNRNANAAVLVQNLPFNIILNYKQKLKELFSPYGAVHSVGIADLTCDKDPQPLFTTRVFFKTEAEATAALEEDKAMFENSIIRVKKFINMEKHSFKPGPWANRANKCKSGVLKADSTEEKIESDEY
ncbi:unnamed protein product [Leptosia nina]|uniref:RRM domain-containing protein n=1 Tax=Leptosia nina TaxID=320188 RepID=A0AAV1JF97_9NEOP